MYTYDQTKIGYLALWNKAELTSPSKATAVASRVVANKDKLMPVQTATGVPWFMVGCMLYRESSLDFNTYLGNGQSLNRRTTEVPAGRGPFSSFLAGAVDAINYEGMQGISDWNIARILYWLERFNGQGYFSHGNSPYIWSWTNEYTSGKFISDHHYDPSAVDVQGGCAAIIKALIPLDADVASAVAGQAPPVVVTPPVQPPTTEPPVTTTPPTHNLATIEQDIQQFVTLLPTLQNVLTLLAPVFPSLKPVIALLPAIQAVVQLGQDVAAAGGNVSAIIAAVQKDLGPIITNVQTVFPASIINVPPGSTVPGSTTPTATGANALAWLEQLSGLLQQVGPVLSNLKASIPATGVSPANA
jgi:lysozyme family protein